MFPNNEKESSFALITDGDIESFKGGIYERKIENLWKNATFRAILQKEKVKTLSSDLNRKHTSVATESCSVNGNRTSSQCSETEETQEHYKLSTCMNEIVEKITSCKLSAHSVLYVSNTPQTFCDVMNSIRIMYHHVKMNDGNTIYICGLFEQSYVCVLPSGRSELCVDTGLEGNWCGIIPFGKPVMLTTTGLVWNMTKRVCEFGDMVSTSNQLDGGGKITIESDGPCLWTMGVEL